MSSFQVKEFVESLPVVPLAENGDGVVAQRRTIFDVYDRVEWSMDARGYITKFSHDVATGALIQRIDDVNGELVTLPDGWATPEGGGLNLVTDFVTDGMGRTLMEIGPAHSVQLDECDVEPVTLRTVRFTVYLDSLHQERTCMGYARGETLDDYDYVTVGPGRLIQRDAGGNVIDEIEARRKCDSGPLSRTEQFERDQWTKWTHNRIDDWGVLRGRRVYFKIPESGDGFLGEDYTESRLDYDSQGRLYREIAPSGTITQRIYNELGWELEQWVGTNDNGATESDPQGEGAPGNNMVRVVTKEYDNGTSGGSGLLTSETYHVVADGATGDRIIQYIYDSKNRISEIHTNDGATEYIETRSYDNLDRVVSTTRYHTNTSSINRVAHMTRQYDSQGRVFNETQFSVNPANGALGATLVKETWYDQEGNTIKQTDPGREACRKFVLDGLGRPAKQYVVRANPEPSSGSSS